MKQNKMKILTLNCFVNDGSISKIMKDIEKITNDECEYYHCYQIGPKRDKNYYQITPWNVARAYFVLSRLTGLKYGIGKIPTFFLIKYIKKVNPDIVHIHCPNFYTVDLYMLFNYLKKEEFSVLITNHAEFFYTGNCAHAQGCKGYLTGCYNCDRVFDKKYKYIFNRTHYEWAKMKKAFSNAPHFQMTVVSPWQLERIHTSPLVSKLRIRIVENGVNTDIFKKKNINFEKYKKYIEENKKIILNVTSNFSDDKDDLKGGYYLLKIASELPDCLFLIAGPTNLSVSSELSENIILLGNIREQDVLADYYNLADLTLLTSKRETFGMACAESMLCGTPVVGFKSGGTESIALREYSSFVEFAESEKLVCLINKWKNSKQTVSDKLAKEALKKYSLEIMANSYLTIYKEMLAEKERLSEIVSEKE